jgi:4'-phosphopantetheinyl transferase
MPGVEYAPHDTTLSSVIHSGALDEREALKAFSFAHAADRWSYVAAHSMLRTMLASALGCAPDRVHIVRDEWQKPRLSAAQHGRRVANSIHFNISHTRGMTAVAMAGRPVGIDVEKPVSIPEIDDFAERFLAAETLTVLQGNPDKQTKASLFFRFWTLGEAFIKATGLGLEQGLKSFAFNAAGAPELLRVTPGWGPPERWRFGLAERELPVGPG